MKTLISDFDGTLYDKNFENNIQRIKKFVEHNNFIISTGRNYQNIKDFILNYKIPFKYLICSDGAVIYNQNGNVIYEKYMNTDLKNNIINNLKLDNNIIEILIDTNKELTNNFNQVASRIYAKIDDKNYGLKKQKEIIDKFKVYAYLSATGLNILPLNINKSEAVKYLSKIDNLGDIYTIGDSYNDIEMLTNYKGYIMENSYIKLENKFSYIESVEKLIDIIEKDI